MKTERKNPFEKTADKVLANTDIFPGQKLYEEARRLIVRALEDSCDRGMNGEGGMGCWGTEVTRKSKHYVVIADNECDGHRVSLMSRLVDRKYKC